jgi:hypothetical protein
MVSLYATLFLVNYFSTNAVMLCIQTPGLNIIGLIYPGRPIANVSFKVYGYMTSRVGLVVEV